MTTPEQTMPNSTTRIWENCLTTLLEFGSEIQPRGIPTKEILAKQTKIDMTLPVVTNKARKISWKFLAGEASWILMGDNRVETIAPYNKNITRFSDDGITFHGAYGPRIAAQIQGVIERLRNDMETRQAFINIWRENPPQNTKDVPCTTSVQFLIRDGKLHAIDNMRSNDIWLGWPYDIFNFSMLSAYVLLCLRAVDQKFYEIELGDLYLNAGSHHLYKDNWDAALQCTQQSEYYNIKPLNLNEFKNPSDFLIHLKWIADQRFDLIQHDWLVEIGEYVNRKSTIGNELQRTFSN